jgi:hypothetical protein
MSGKSDQNDMSMKLIFLNCVPLSIVFGQKVDAQYYIDKGFDVEYWDLSSLYYDKSKIDLYFSGSKDYKFSAPAHKYFHNKSDVIQLLKLLPRNSFVFNLSRHSQACLDDFWILRLLKRLDIPYGVMQIENQFNNPVPHSKREQFISKFSYIKERIYPFKQFFRTLDVLNSLITLKIKTFIFNKYDFYAKPAIAVGVGRKGRRSFQHLIVQGTSYVSIPSPSINWENAEPDEAEQICLFVDESIGYEPDVKLDDMATMGDLSSYYKELLRIFSLVEEVTGLKVVIGASGKVEYTENPFGREIVYKKTLQLAARASLVIGHSSSALYHCLCSKLPVLLLNDPNFTNEKKSCIKNLSAASSLAIYETTSLQKNDIHYVLQSGVVEGFVEEYFREENIHRDYRDLISEALFQFSKQK